MNLGKQAKSIIRTELGDVTVAGPHDAVHEHLRFVRHHSRNSTPMGPSTLPRQADAAWIARELGDVPTRYMHGHQTMDDFPVSLSWLDELAAIDTEAALAFALLGAGSVPVESLGRDGP